MRFSLSVFLFIAVLLFSESWTSLAEDKPVQDPGNLQKLLTSYLTDRLADAKLVLRNVEEQRRAGLVGTEEVLAETDEIDRWELYLRMVTEWRLVANHPIFRELRKEFLVPEPPPIESIKDRKAISVAIQEYLQKKLQRAGIAADRAVALYKLRRATEADVAAAKSKVEGLKLLIEVERLGVGRDGE